MTDIPIIFSAPMVLALLAGRKTQTRRLAWRVAKQFENGGSVTVASPWQKVKPGDRLWVRENLSRSVGSKWQFAANKAPLMMMRDDPMAIAKTQWAHAQDRAVIPSIHMPRWASRLTLVVTATKIEPLQNISADDAEAEGLWYCEEGDAAGFWFASPEAKEKDVWGDGAVECYMRLWNHLHGDGAWGANPDVVALTFEVHQQNIDALKEAA